MRASAGHTGGSPAPGVSPGGAAAADGAGLVVGPDIPVPDDAILEDWGTRMIYGNLTEAEDDLADWERCLHHLMTSQMDCFRKGERMSVGDCVLRAAGMGGDHDPVEANKLLGNYGMRVKDHYIGERSFKYLMVANAHQGLSQLFRDTHWSAKSGASGVWVQSLRRVPMATSGKNAARFDGVLTRYITFPLQDLIDVERQGGEYARA